MIVIIKSIHYPMMKGETMTTKTTAKTIEEIIESIQTEQTGPKSLIDILVTTIRIPRDVVIMLEIIGSAAGKSRSRMASDLVIAAARQVWESDAFNDPKYQAEFKKRCLEAGVYLDEFLTQQEQLELWETDHTHLNRLRHSALL